MLLTIEKILIVLLLVEKRTPQILTHIQEDLEVSI
nr:MAG TPA: hypothetical protein [Podoviridae sp. ctY3D12]DAN87403.1 MAG TPA: hypothetical protein [Caudoviricetes sp.]